MNIQSHNNLPQWQLVVPLKVSKNEKWMNVLMQYHLYKENPAINSCQPVIQILLMSSTQCPGEFLNLFLPSFDICMPLCAKIYKFICGGGGQITGV